MNNRHLLLTKCVSSLVSVIHWPLWWHQRNTNLEHEY